MRLLTISPVAAIASNQRGVTSRSTPSANSSREVRRPISRLGATYTLEDLGSKNCTLVNDRPVKEPTRLSDGDAIQIGSTVFVFRVTDIMASTESAANGPPN